MEGWLILVIVLAVCIPLGYWAATKVVAGIKAKGAAEAAKGDN